MTDKNTDNVVQFTSKKQRAVKDHHHIIRLAPELDGIELLYSNDEHPELLFSMSVIGWALMKDGSVDALIPWLGEIMLAKEITDTLNGHWEGFYDQETDKLLLDAPHYKELELTSAAEERFTTHSDNTVIQELPDTVGTHAVMSGDGFQTITVTPVISWQLYGDGRLMAMITGDEPIDNTPILPGDPVLKPAQQHPDFHYFFHYHLANKLKQGDAEAMAALAYMLYNHEG